MVRLASFFILASVVSGCSMPKFEHTRTESQVIETRPVDASDAPVPLSKIELTTFNGQIVVNSHAANEVKLEVKYKAYGDSEEQAQENAQALKCDYAIDGGVLSIKATKPVEQWLASAAFEVTVPENCELMLKTSNGKLEAVGMVASVNAETTNGSIEMRSIAGDINAKTSNGRVTITDSRGAVVVKTSNGKIDYSGDLLGNANQLQTSNGTVKVALNPEQLVDVEANTSNGKIACTLPTQKVMKEDKKHYRAMVGNGAEAGTVTLSINTSNGSVTIDAISAAEEEAASTPTETEIGEPLTL